jgi:uncharacterized protein (DUF2141 family)
MYDLNNEFRNDHQLSGQICINAYSEQLDFINDDKEQENHDDTNVNIDTSSPVTAVSTISCYCFNFFLLLVLN